MRNKRAAGFAGWRHKKWGQISEVESTDIPEDALGTSGKSNLLGDKLGLPGWTGVQMIKGESKCLIHAWLYKNVILF